MDKRLAIIAAVGFAITGVILLVRINEPLYGVSSLLACVVCVGYLLLRGRVASQINATQRTLWYDVGWLVSWGTAMLVYVFRPEPYERPLAFFVLVALSCGIIAAKVVRCRLSNRATVGTLAQIVAVGLSLVWTVTLMYPTVVGIDPWTHRAAVLRILDGESGLLRWYRFPVMSALTAGVMAVTGSEYRIAAMSVSFLQVATGVSLLFLIGRRVAETRVGLLAALVMAFSSWHIFFSYWTIPNGLGLTLLLLVVYLVLKYHDRPDKRLVLAFLATVALLSLTHILVAAWLTVLLALWVLLILVDKDRPPKRRIIPLLTNAVAGIGIAAGVLWASGFLNNLRVFLRQGLHPGLIGLTKLPGLDSYQPPPPLGPGDLPTGIIVPDLPQTSSPLYIDALSQPSWESVFNSSGMVLGFVLAIVGCLWLLSKYYRSTPSLFILLSFGFFLTFGIVPALLGMSVLEHRWWYAAQVFGSIPIAVALIGLHKVGKGVIVVVGVVAISFLMMMGLPSNMDNHTFSKNQLVRYALTQEEVAAAEWALTEYDTRIGIDAYYMYVSYLTPGQGHRFTNITTNILASDFDSLECDIVLIRDAVAYEPFAIGGGSVYKLLYDPNIVLIESGYELVYSARGVNGYVRVGQ